MRLVLCLPLAVGCAALPAQSPGPVPVGPTAQLLERNLRQSKVGRLVVVDGPKGEWRAKVNALNVDPAWIDLDLQVSYYGAKAAEVEALLRQSHQAGPAPQWVLFGENARAVASGGTPPEGAALAKAAQEGGVRSTLQILRDFSRRNPDHLEALQALARGLGIKAARLTRARFEGKADPLRPADESFDFTRFQKEQDEKEEAKLQDQKEAKPIPQLTAEEDQAIWGELADLMARAFRSGDWVEMDNWGLAPDESAAHSPLLQNVCRAAVPEVERALTRNPGDWNLWRLWLGLTRTFGGKPIRPLLDSLLPLPTLSPADWPPYAVRDAYVKDARKRKDWNGIREFLLPQVEASRLWEAAQGKSSVQFVKDGKVQEAPETGDYWRNTLEPLVEALLWLGDLGQADELVRRRYADHPWSGLPKRAEALAQRCGQLGLAAQWGALGTGK